MSKCAPVDNAEYTKVEPARIIGRIERKDPAGRDSTTDPWLLHQVINDHADAEITRRNLKDKCARGCDFVGTQQISDHTGDRVYMFYWSEGLPPGSPPDAPRPRFRVMVKIRLRVVVTRTICEPTFEPSQDVEWDDVSWDRQAVLATYLETGTLPTGEALLAAST